MSSRFIDKHLTVGGIDPLLPVLLEAINKADDISLAIAFFLEPAMYIVASLMTLGVRQIACSFSIVPNSLRMLGYSFH